MKLVPRYTKKKKEKKHKENTDHRKNTKRNTKKHITKNTSHGAYIVHNCISDLGNQHYYYYYILTLAGTEGGGVFSDGTGVCVTAERATEHCVGETPDDTTRSATEEGVPGGRREQY